MSQIFSHPPAKKKRKRAPCFGREVAELREISQHWHLAPVSLLSLLEPETPLLTCSNNGVCLMVDIFVDNGC